MFPASANAFAPIHPPAGSTVPPPVRFTEEDSERANDEWGANCGPHALAAALSATLEEVRPHLGDFRGWMNPTHMKNALRSMGYLFSLRSGLRIKGLCNGINRVQWEGSWLNPGVPPAAAYQHTHWVAYQNGFVYCTATRWRHWIPQGLWSDFHAANNDLWHITHHYQNIVRSKYGPQAAPTRRLPMAWG